MNSYAAPVGIEYSRLQNSEVLFYTTFWNGLEQVSLPQKSTPTQIGDQTLQMTRIIDSDFFRGKINKLDLLGAN